MGIHVKVRVELSEGEVGSLHSGKVVKKQIARNIVLVLAMEPLEETVAETTKLSIVRRRNEKDVLDTKTRSKEKAVKGFKESQADQNQQSDSIN